MNEYILQYEKWEQSFGIVSQKIICYVHTEADKKISVKMSKPLSLLFGWLEVWSYHA